MIKKSNFRQAWWLPGAHLQTMWATATRRRVKLLLKRERIELPDGDFIDIDWIRPPKEPRKNAPIVLVLHGLGGSIQSHYASTILNAISRYGWRGAFMHFRGASGMPNRLPRGYHSGETNDVAYIAELIRNREPNTKIAGIGYSLGGNVILKWLGETKNCNPLTCAVAVSVPFELEVAANRLKQGFSRFYQWWILSQLRREIVNKFKAVEAPISITDIERYRTFWEFDTHITAPLHGFEDAHDYYRRCSSRQFLKHIHIPTLVLHSVDDPFMTPAVLPQYDELSEKVTLEISANGGHVGFIAGTIPGRPIYWLEKRIINYLASHLGLYSDELNDDEDKETTVLANVT